MKHEEQAKNLKQVLEHEIQVEALKEALYAEQSKGFGKQKPIPPARQTVKFTPPTIKHGCKINWLIMFLPAGIDIVRYKGSIPTP